jgi:hypothetical protein
MELNKIFKDSDFQKTKVPSGQRFVFLGYENGVEGGEVVIRYKDSDGNFGNIASGGIVSCGESEIEVNSLQNNKIVISTNSVPVFIKTNLGNFYPIEKNTLSQVGDSFHITVSPYLIYDNAKVFTGTWVVYLSGGANGKDGQSLKYDEVGLKKNLSQYDDKLYKFSYLAYDTGELYIKLSNTLGDWSEPLLLDNSKQVKDLTDRLDAIESNLSVIISNIETELDKI